MARARAERFRRSDLLRRSLGLVKKVRRKPPERRVWRREMSSSDDDADELFDGAELDDDDPARARCLSADGWLK